MNIKLILIVLGEPYSTFSEIFAKYFTKYKKIKKKIIIVGNLNLLEKQINKLKYNLNLNKITSIEEAKEKTINIIDIEFKYKKVFTNISEISNNYIKECFDKAIEILKKCKEECVLINGPISKKHFLKKNFLGITEYLSNKTQSSGEVMLIYNEKISVSPLTTHVPIKYVSKMISKRRIVKNVQLINKFYKKMLKKEIKFAVLGLNPHCETIDKFNEDEKIVKPSIKYLKRKKIIIDGPFSADTFFLKKNIKKYDVVIGMYHDQVLIPVKTLFNFNAINITIGLPFIRISPDHGPNVQMLGKNKSDYSSLSYAIKFIEKLK
ncbi:4-hydroxythreonine-4-phosphate dehydrogenase PdxA [Candidatus Pelagibacter sp.]|nr:4-hydroxythreonine-4-phosphate dehydrogenase PdxA [Candidatus Pelagibacter sp.]